MSEQDNPGALWGGPRRGRPAKDPGLKLTPAQQAEYGRAKAGKEEWVSAAVAAYMLGISTDTLRKRRQRKVGGLLPEYQAPKSNRQGARYRWSSVQRCAMPGHDDRLEEQRREVDRLRVSNEALGQELADVKDLLAQLLARDGAGLKTLVTQSFWAVDEHQYIQGLAALHAGCAYQPLTWLEALTRPWTHERDREPYHRVASQRLELIRDALDRGQSAG